MNNIEINHHTFSDVMEFVAEVQVLHPEARLIGITAREDDILLRFKLEWRIMFVAMPLNMTLDQCEALAWQFDQRCMSLHSALDDQTRAELLEIHKLIKDILNADYTGMIKAQIAMVCGDLIVRLDAFYSINSSEALHPELTRHEPRTYEQIYLGRKWIKGD